MLRNAKVEPNQVVPTGREGMRQDEMTITTYLEIRCIVFEEVVVGYFVAERGVEEDRRLVGPAARHVTHRVPSCIAQESDVIVMIG